MREFLINLFHDWGDGSVTEIKQFNIWHIMYIVLILGISIGISVYLKNKDEKYAKKTLDILAVLVGVTYILDFFIEPFVTSDFTMNIDKLPFHICTSMGIMALFVQFNKKFDFLKETVTGLSLVATLMYLTYPGSALGGISAFSYKVMQTFLFHGLLFNWAFVALATNQTKFEWKNIWKEGVVLVILELWAAIGNASYSNELHHYDWLFITGSTFPFVPKLLMPVAVFVAIMGMAAICYGIYFLTKNIIEKHNNKSAE